MMMCLTSCYSQEVKLTDRRVVATRIGEATFYTVRSNGGTRTASGIPLSDTKFTAASIVFPMGSALRITNLSNNRSIEVKVTDKGPYATTSRGLLVKPLTKHPTRIVDMSYAAAKALNIQTRGVARVKVQQIK